LAEISIRGISAMDIFQAIVQGWPRLIVAQLIKAVEVAGAIGDEDAPASAQLLDSSAPNIRSES
jgi:hypothetical protein